MSYEITKGSDNIFADLGFDNPEEHHVKAELAMRINAILDKRGLKQKEAAKLLGATQSNISQLSNGRLSGFSLERLIGFLMRLDRDIQLLIKRKPKSRQQAMVKVVAA